MKVYIIVFVCMATKAIHLGVCANFTTDAFLAEFQWFVSRRGIPKMVRSNIGANLAGVSKVLREAWGRLTSESKENMAQRQIAWHHSPPKDQQLRRTASNSGENPEAVHKIDSFTFHPDV